MNQIIGIGSFIKQVKQELVSARCGTNEKPFYALDSVELEITVALDVDANGVTNLVVVELGAEIKASQTHRVTVHLKPWIPVDSTNETDDGGGGNINMVTGERVNISNSNNAFYVKAPIKGRILI